MPRTPFDPSLRAPRDRRVLAGAFLSSLALLVGSVSLAQDAGTPPVDGTIAESATETRSETRSETVANGDAARVEPGAVRTAADRAAAWARHQELDQASLFHGLEWRSIGPVTQGGRVVSLAPIPGDAFGFYAAYASGGLWKTRNAGSTFEPLFDFQPTTVIGAIATDPNLPERVWVGTGESNSSRSSYGGVGIFRSDDGGATWERSGLEDSDRFGRIRVDPRDSNRVYAAVLGRLYTEGGARGVFRTRDGGATWEHVLDTAAEAGDGWTGAADVVLDPSNPDVLYAASWHRERRPWNFVEAGEGSGIWKSTDGGDTWKRLGGGLPQGEFVGRIGLALHTANPQILYASVDNQEPLPEAEWDLGDSPVDPKRLRSMSEAEFLEQDEDAIEDFVRSNDLDPTIDAKKLMDLVRGGELTIEQLIAEIDDANANLFQTDIRGLEIYRSDDGGDTWSRTHDEPLREVVYTYGYYFGEIAVDPKDPDIVYATGVPLVQSMDGGATWRNINPPEVHVDHHAIYIDPERPERVVLGNDGGIDISHDRGDSWQRLDRDPVGQIYTLAVDMEDPYRVYVGLQDNGTLRGSSQAEPGVDTWTFLGGGDGMHIAVDPRDSTTYIGFQFGFYTRIDPGGARTMVRPRDALREPALRYNWSTPILLSPHSPEVLYFGSNRLYRSMDKGDTWNAISPDLTASEMRGDVPFGTLTSVSESDSRFGLIWAGTDDGEVHVTPDGGVTWRRATTGLPRDRWVSRVEASRHETERAYVSMNGYRDDDDTAYIFVTEDLGRTWRSLAAGLPNEPVNVVREDPVNADVLYVGTDRGAYVSLDRGESWQGLPGVERRKADGALDSVEGRLPNVPVHDLVVHPREREIVVGTHGRSAWVLDALPIQELEFVEGDALHVFPLEDVQFRRGWRSRPSRWFQPLEDLDTTKIRFWSAADGEVVLTVRDADGRALYRAETPARRGINTVEWNRLFDQDLALAAERAALESAEAEAKPKGRKARKSSAEKTGSETVAETSVETPRADAVEYGWRLFATPATYTVEIARGDDLASTELVVTPPPPRDPRMKPEPKIRGERDDDE